MSWVAILSYIISAYARLLRQGDQHRGRAVVDKRWCILTDALPHELTVGGEEFPIDVRTSTAPSTACRKLREDIPEEAKLSLPAQAPPDCRTPLMLWIRPWDTSQALLLKKEPKRGKPDFDYFQDAELISAAFPAGIRPRIGRADRMHWWRFLSLLGGASSSTRFMEVVGIRTMEIDPKESAESKAKKRKAKKAVAEGHPKRRREEERRPSGLQLAGFVRLIWQGYDGQ